VTHNGKKSIGSAFTHCKQYAYMSGKNYYCNYLQIVMDTKGDILGVKRPGREADDSTSSSANVMNGGAIPPLSHPSSWHSA
jgi:hypothetical protein